MNKQLLVIFSLTLSIILIPSFLLSLGLSAFYGNFWWLFLICCGAIFVIGQISNQFFQKKIASDIENFRYRIEELKNEQSVNVTCAYCKQMLNIPIKLNKRNTHPCPNCKQINLIVFQFTSAQITTPLELPQLGSDVIASSNESKT